MHNRYNQQSICLAGDHDRVCRCHHLQDVIRTLKKGLQNEPGNSLHRSEMEKKELKLAKEEAIHDFMSMAERE